MNVSKVVGKHSIVWRSNIQEELSLGEILYCLQTNKKFSLEQKRVVLAIVMEKQVRITQAFDRVSHKLAHSFVYCLPKALPLHRWSEKFASKTLFKLAVLYDVYKRSRGSSVDERIEAVFENVMTALEGAKFEARQRRNWRFCSRVMTLIDSITKDSLAASALVQETTTTSDSEDSSAEDDKKMAIRRYRALIGLGDNAISRDQLFRVVSDLVRNDPWIQLPDATAALDRVLGLQHA